MTEQAALGAHEIGQPIDDRRFRMFADDNLIAAFETQPRGRIISQQNRGPPDNFNPDHRILGQNQVISRLGTVVESQANPDPENAMGNAAVIGSTAVNRGHPDAVTNHLGNIKLIIDPHPVTNSADPVGIMNENVIERHQISPRTTGGEFCHQRLLQLTGKKIIDLPFIAVIAA